MTMERIFKNNKEENRYELHVGETIAFAEYMINDLGVVYMTHTLVPTELEGQGVGSQLIEKSLEDIRAQELKVFPLCPFVKSYINKHKQWQDLL